jgi:hypothetical protein
LAWVKFRSRVLTALNLLPSIATLSFAEQFKTATHSIPARTLIARRDNLSATITALRERLATLEAPEWNYS